MATLITAAGSTFRVETETVDVTTNAPRPDKDWRETDSNGHEHYWQDGWPTLEWIVDGAYWCEQHQEEHEEGHYACKVCGEEVKPGMRGPSGIVETIPGMRSYFIDDQPVDEQTFNVAVAKAKAEAEKT
jgi:hypothetical protein